MSDQVWWYATRAAGMMTWATATASVVFGLLLSTRAIRSRTGPWFLDLHRFLGGISVVFLVAHVATLWADSYVEFGPRELFVPGASTWRPEAIAWGIIAAYLLIAVEVSSLLRKRISKGLWRGIHFTSFAAMIGGSYHAYLAGTDVDNPITWAIAGIGSLLVMGLISMRLQRQDPDEPGSPVFNDNRAILEEMRQRLEELPIPERTPQPQIAANPASTLPRRAPVSEAIPGMAEPEPATGPEIGFDRDPFAAVPLAGDEPELGNWAEPSAADPFRAIEGGPGRPPAPTAHPAEPTASRPFSSDPDTWAADGADLFADEPEISDADPFAHFGVAPASADPAPAPVADPIADLAPVTEPTPASDLFAAAMPAEPAVEMAGNPFEPVDPTPISLQAPAPATPASVVGAGPPPLPDAVDPVTGEPDEEAYSTWLREWLAYAEQYGDEAPDDPNRV
ncbi:MAG: hypothetical protein AAF548_17365 [Actinomycetota bacterium]